MSWSAAALARCDLARSPPLEFAAPWVARGAGVSRAGAGLATALTLAGVGVTRGLERGVM